MIVLCWQCSAPALSCPSTLCDMHGSSKGATTGSMLIPVQQPRHCSSQAVGNQVMCAVKAIVPCNTG
jgi:hypothetical protein